MNKTTMCERREIVSKAFLLAFAFAVMPVHSSAQVRNQGDQTLNMSGTLANGLHFTSMVLHPDTRTITYNTTEMGGFTAAEPLDSEYFAALYAAALQQSGKGPKPGFDM